MRAEALTGALRLAGLLQEPATGSRSVNELLLYMGIAIIAVLAFGFLLARRGRQRPVASAFGEPSERENASEEDDDSMDQLL